MTASVQPASEPQREPYEHSYDHSHERSQLPRPGRVSSHPSANRIILGSRAARCRRRNAYGASACELTQDGTVGRPQLFSVAAPAAAGDRSDAAWRCRPECRRALGRSIGHRLSGHRSAGRGPARRAAAYERWAGSPRCLPPARHPGCAARHPPRRARELRPPSVTRPGCGQSLHRLDRPVTWRIPRDGASARSRLRAPAADTRTGQQRRACNSSRPGRCRNRLLIACPSKRGSAGRIVGRAPGRFPALPHRWWCHLPRPGNPAPAGPSDTAGPPGTHSAQPPGGYRLCDHATHPRCQPVVAAQRSGD